MRNKLKKRASFPLQNYHLPLIQASAPSLQYLCDVQGIFFVAMLYVVCICKYYDTINPITHLSVEFNIFENPTCHDGFPPEQGNQKK